MHRMIREITEELNSVSTEKTLGCAHSCPPPDRKAVVRVIKNLQALLFPLCFSRVKPGMPDEELLEITVKELADSSVDFVLRVWTTAPEYWNVFFDTNERIYKEFNKQGIKFPFPQIQVHQ